MMKRRLRDVVLRSAWLLLIVPAVAWSEEKSVLDRIEVYGNIELRQEFNFNLDDQPNRPRARVRFRLGANYDWHDTIRLGARMTTGPQDNPAAPYQDFGSSLTSYTFTVDRLFIRWKPSWDLFTEPWIEAGKFGLPFYRNPVYNQLVWDHDVQPEGVMVGNLRNLTDTGTGRATVAIWEDMASGGIDLSTAFGVITLLEQQFATNAYAALGQVATRLGSNELGGMLAFDFYWYSEVDPLLDLNAGNAVTTTPDSTQVFESEFTVLHPLAAFRYGGWRVPIELGAEYIKNVRANNPRDEGYSLGITVGKLLCPDLEDGLKGDWRLWYQFQYVEQDAVFSPFVQDDTLIRTNARMHLFGLTYAPMDNMYTRVWADASSRIFTEPVPTMESSQYQWRARADIKISF